MTQVTVTGATVSGRVVTGVTGVTVSGRVATGVTGVTVSGRVATGVIVTTDGTTLHRSRLIQCSDIYKKEIIEILI